MRLLHAARLSKLKDDSTGIEKQDEQVQNYASAYDHEIVAQAADTDVSGSTDPMKRPRLGPYLTDPVLRSGYDGVIASALDRLGRNARHLMELRDWAEVNGKRLIVISPALQWPPSDPNDFASPIIWDLLGRLAEYELAAITKRNRETQKWLRANGYLEGKPPWGFLVANKDNHKTLVPDPELVPVIREVAKRYLAGASLFELCRWLDSKGVKPLSSDQWADNSLRRYLANPILIGRRKDASGVTFMTCEPILDEVTFYRVQATLAGRAKHKGQPSDESMLSGVIYCATCHRAMSYHKVYNKRADGTRVYSYYYRCHGTTKEPSRCRNMVRLEWADAAMASWVTDVIGHLEMIERTLIPGDDHDAEIAEVTAAIASLDQDAPDYDESHAWLRAERTRLKSLPSTETVITEKPSGVKVRQFWDSLGDSTALRRDWLKAGKVKAYATKDGFSVEMEMGGDWSIPVPAAYTPRLAP